MANPFRLTKDRRGNYRRQNLGYHAGSDGSLKKSTFTFSRDHKEACRRVVVLERMWDAVREDWSLDDSGGAPMWTTETRNIALAVARGEETIYLELPESERLLAEQYPDSETVIAVWLGTLKELFPFLDLRLAGEQDRAAAEAGADSLASALEQKAKAFQTLAGRVRGHTEGEPLHKALDAYADHMKEKHGIAGYGRTQVNQIRMIQRYVEDRPLNMLTADTIDTILRIFCDRPKRRDREDHLAYSTCRNVLITFRQFLIWLDRSERFEWELPRKHRFTRCRIRKLPEDSRKKHKRKWFNRTELELIWRYASPWERALALLALNCGFSKAEIAKLHPWQIVRAKHHTYIKRDRDKSDVYAEWVLWPETLDAIAYLEKFFRNGDSDHLVTSKSGRPLDRRTPKGNENQTIKNHWDRLMERIQADCPEFHRLPFKHLRKTGAQVIRHKVGTPELATMFLSHGERSDNRDDPLLADYTDRDWRKLHRALLKMRRYYRRVFAAVENPWLPKLNRVSPLVLDKIRSLRSQGKTLKEIAEAVGLHWVTIGKCCRNMERAASPAEEAA